MHDPRDTVDIPGLSLPIVQGRGGGMASGAGPKPWLMLWFRCAGAYARAYRSRDGSAYVGRCPLCGGSISFPIGPGGTDQRMFEVSC